MKSVNIIVTPPPVKVMYLCPFCEKNFSYELNSGVLLAPFLRGYVFTCEGLAPFLKGYIFMCEGCDKPILIDDIDYI